MKENIEFSNNFKDLMQRMWSFNENNRLTIEQIKQHPWVLNEG